MNAGSHAQLLPEPLLNLLRTGCSAAGRFSTKVGIFLTVKQDAVDAAHERYGFFVLISNEVKDPVTALILYRMRDVVEKAFWNVKERLNLKRTMTSSESSLEGKLFVEFIALIYLSYIQKKMDEKGLFATYTLHELLDELDVIECFKEPGKALIQGEVLKKQEQIYRDLDVTPLLAAGQPADVYLSEFWNSLYYKLT